VHETDQGSVSAFAVNPINGGLKKLNSVPSGGSGPTHIAIHPTGHWVFVAHYGSGHVAVLPVNTDGSVAQHTQTLVAGEKAHMAFVPDPAGRFLLVPCLGSDYVAQFVFTAGKLSPNAIPFVHTAKGSGPRQLALHPSGKFAYLGSELHNTVTSFVFNADNGQLSNPNVVSTLPANFTLQSFVAAVRVAPSGRFVYVSNRCQTRSHSSIAILSVHNATGELTLIAVDSGGGDVFYPRDFTIHPSGRFLVVGNQNSNSATLFAVHSDSGRLNKISTKPTGSAPSWLWFTTLTS